MKFLMIALVVSSLIHAYTATEDALISQGSYTVSGTFGQHDFSDAEPAFDWAFTTANGASYQLQGNEPTANDVFGWKAVNIEAPTPAWYMFALGTDVDGDGTQKFDWVLLSTNSSNKLAYKLAGVADNGTFKYSSKLDIDYRVDGTSITVAEIGGLDDYATDGAMLVGNWAGFEGYNTFSFFEDETFVATRYSDDGKINDGAVAGRYRYDSSSGMLLLDMEHIGSNLNGNLPDKSIPIRLDAYSMSMGDDELYIQPVSNTIEGTWRDGETMVMLLDDGRLLYTEGVGSTEGFEAGHYSYYDANNTIRLGEIVYDESDSLTDFYGKNGDFYTVQLSGDSLLLNGLNLKREFRD